MTIATPISVSWLDDGLTTYAPTLGGIQTAYGAVAGAPRIIDLGAAGVPWHGIVAFEPSVLDESSGDETYLLTIEGSAAADFSGGRQDLAEWNLGAPNAQDVIALSNVYDGVVYRYVRLKITVSGTTPQVRVKAFVKPLADLDDYTLAELITVQATLAQNIHNANTNFRAWMAGTANGGEYGNGLYPLSDGLGNTVLVKCPAQIAADGGDADPYAGSNIDVQGGDELALVIARNNAKNNATPLTGNSGQVPITEAKVLTGCSIDLRYKPIRFGHNLAAVLPEQTYPAGSQHAPVTLTTKGPALDIGNSPDADENFSKVVRVLGDYPGDGTNQNAPFVAVRIKDDQASRSSYDIAIQNHRGDGLDINSDTEKKTIRYQFNNLYEGFAVALRSIGGLTMDEVSVDVEGTVCSKILYAQEQTQISYAARFNIENVRPAPGAYAIEDYSRKGACWSGEIRGVNGDLIKVETRQSGYTGGGPNLVFDNLRIIQHFCGRITLVNPKSVSGTLLHDHVDNSRSHDNCVTVAWRSAFPDSETNIFYPQPISLIDQPGFQIGAVLENCTLTYVSRRNVCPYGARIGISDWVNPLTSGGTFSTGSAFSGKSIRLEIEMGDRNIDSTGANGNPLTVTGSFGSGTVTGSFTITDEDGPLFILASGRSLAVGQVLTGAGVPAGMTVVSVLADDPPLGRHRVNIGHVAADVTVGVGTVLTVTAGEALTPGQFLIGEGVPRWTRVNSAPEPGKYVISRNLSLSSRSVRAGGSPDMFCAIWADLGTGSTIWADGNLHGNIRISDGWKRGTIHVSAAWARNGYRVEIDPDANFSTDFIIHGPISFAEVTGLGWAFQGVQALNVTDFGGISMRYDGEGWVMSRFIDAPAVSTLARGSALNAPKVKRRGLGVVDAATSAILIASGPEDTDPWISTAGGTVTPRFLDATDDFDLRQQAADSEEELLSDDAKHVYDRLIHDLIYAGVYTPNPTDTSDASGSLLKAVYLFNGPSEGAARTNLLFNTWELTKHGLHLNHIPGRGYDPTETQNTGSYLEVTGYAGNLQGTGEHNLALGACAEELYTSTQNTAASNPVTIGADISQIRATFHRLDGGNNVYLNSTTATAASSWQAGSYRLGMGFTWPDGGHSIQLFGGTLTTGSKTANLAVPSNLYVFRYATTYLTPMLSMALIGEGDGWTPEKVDATLSALNLARTGLRALA